MIPAMADPPSSANCDNVRRSTGRWLPSAMATAIEPGPTVSGIVNG